MPGLADAEIFTAATAPLKALGGWQVALAGLYHQSTVPSVWRDLNARYPAEMQGHALRARPNGHVENAIGKAESWHQLYVTRFSARDDAERFCRTLRGRQQQCTVEAVDPAVIAAVEPRAADERSPERAR